VSLHEYPHVEEKVLASGLDDPKKSGYKWQADGSTDRVTLDEIGKKQGERLLIKSVALLDHKGRVK
jgi:hypothetical protein